mmetsp:Transcript_13413/g.37746  ORF Transcript_13413/g.37746 Transcript_13413/m.37746 type:complete len:226 (-) Transcript_13413:1509-2186(-)
MGTKARIHSSEKSDAARYRISTLRYLAFISDASHKPGPLLQPRTCEPVKIIVRKMTSTKKSLCVAHQLFLGMCCLCQAFLTAEGVFGFVPRNSAVIAVSASRTFDHEDSCFHRAARPEREETLRMVGDAQGDYYGEASGSYMVKELSLIEELEQIVQLASQPIPERPDGIVVVVKYSSASRAECRATEAEYERFARGNPATIFMRCMEEFEDAHLLLEQVNVRSW